MDNNPTNVVTTLATQTLVQPLGRPPPESVFKEGHTKVGGRVKGTSNKHGGELRQMIMNAIIEPATYTCIRWGEWEIQAGLGWWGRR
jgi:hypothetical protein